MTDDELCRRATYEEAVLANSAKSAEATRFMAVARTYRARNDHAAAGVLERDAAALLRMARRAELVRIVSDRLGLVRDPGMGWRKPKNMSRLYLYNCGQYEVSYRGVVERRGSVLVWADTGKQVTVQHGDLTSTSRYSNARHIELEPESIVDRDLCHCRACSPGIL
jgi:hypothetical protein